MSMSGSNIDKSLTENRQALNSILTQIPIKGYSIDLIKSLKIAYLALKKRGEESTGEKRVVVFVGSPLIHDIEDLREIGRMYKKYKIMIDVINFGETTTNQERLEALIEEADTDKTSHIVTIPQGPHSLSDLVMSSEVLSEQSEGPSAAPESGFGFGGMDVDDEQLQLAIQLSQQEYQREVERRQAEQNKGSSQATQSSQSTQSIQQSTPQQMEDDYPEDEDEDLRKALAMSLAESLAQTTQQPVTPPTSQKQSLDDAMIDEDEEAEIQKALLMSMQEDTKENIDDIMQDEDFLEDLKKKTVDKKDKNDKDDKDNKKN